MPDRNATINLQSVPFRAKDLGPDRMSTSLPTDDVDLVSLEAAIEEATRTSWNSASLLDHVAADWAAKTNADEKIIHAFLGIDDPIGQEAEAVFHEEQVDAALEVFLETLPHNQLQSGELAALSAFDKALESGFDAEEALLEAIKAAEGENVTLTVGAALTKAPVKIVLGWDKMSPVQIKSELSDGKNEGENGPSSIPFVSIIAQESVSNFALSVPEINDAAFGFGFQFEVHVVETKEQAENYSFQNGTDIVTATSNAVALTNTEVSESIKVNLLVGGSGQDALGSNAGIDYLYTDLPTNYQASVHDASNPLANSRFSAAGSINTCAGGASDNLIWGGAGNDQLHGNTPDTSSALFEEFKFGLGLTAGGDDTIEGGVIASTCKLNYVSKPIFTNPSRHNI